MTTKSSSRDCADRRRRRRSRRDAARELGQPSRLGGGHASHGAGRAGPATRERGDRGGRAVHEPPPGTRSSPSGCVPRSTGSCSSAALRGHELVGTDAARAAARGLARRPRARRRALLPLPALRLAGCRCPRPRAPARDALPARDEIELPLRGQAAARQGRPAADRRSTAPSTSSCSALVGALVLFFASHRDDAARLARPRDRRPAGRRRRRRRPRQARAAARDRQALHARQLEDPPVRRGDARLRARRGRRGGRPLVRASAGPST